MRKRANEEKEASAERWLLTYSDMMNNLLILFMVLYAMSVIDASKFKALAREMNNAFSDTPMTDSAVPPEDTALAMKEQTLTPSSSPPATEGTDKFDQIYEILKAKISEGGYGDQLSIEKGDNYIRLRFGENVLFYPDSSVIKSNNVEVLKFIGDTLSSINSMIQTVEIGGHTATTGEQTTSFFSWELSSERAISVLKYLVQSCNMPESKMSISGFSRYHPIASNETEESRQLNRRVEIKITRVDGNISK